MEKPMSQTRKKPPVEPDMDTQPLEGTPPADMSPSIMPSEQPANGHANIEGAGMDVIFFRHGIAVEQEDWTGEDRERPLTKEGIARTKRAARGLAHLGVRPSIVLTSPLVRAIETADIIRKKLDLNGDVYITEDLSPMSAPEQFLARLSEHIGEASVLCVGHEPHISATISTMISGKTATSMDMKKAGACCIHFIDGPKAGTGVLQWFLPAKFLRIIGEK